MAFLTRAVIILVLILVVGGVGFLATWDMPPPSSTIEKVIPNDRFKR